MNRTAEQSRTAYRIYTQKKARQRNKNRKKVFKIAALSFALSLFRVLGIAGEIDHGATVGENITELLVLSLVMAVAYMIMNCTKENER